MAPPGLVPELHATYGTRDARSSINSWRTGEHAIMENTLGESVRERLGAGCNREIAEIGWELDGRPPAGAASIVCEACVN